MLTGVEWAAVGVAATLLGILLAHRLGWIQVSIMRHEHALNRAKTTPKVGTSVCFEERPHKTQPVTTLALVTQIYNVGDAAASSLVGTWTLLCRKNEHLNRTLPIGADYLTNASPYKIDIPFGDVATWRDVVNGKFAVIVEVGIDFTYTGLEADGQQSYSAHYRFDNEHRIFVKQQPP